MLADMLCQLRVGACTERTRATGDRVRRRLFERAIDAGAREIPHPRDARHTVTRAKEGESVWLIVSTSCGPKGQGLLRIPPIQISREPLLGGEAGVAPPAFP